MGGDGEECGEWRKTHVHDVNQIYAGKILKGRRWTSAFSSHRSAQMDTPSESSVGESSGVMKEIVKAEGTSESTSRESTRELMKGKHLDPSVTANTEREIKSVHRNLVDLEPDVEAQCPEEPLVDKQRVGCWLSATSGSINHCAGGEVQGERPLSRQSEADRLSVEAQSPQKSHQRPRQRLLVTSSSRSRPRPLNGLLGGEAQAVTRNSERPPFKQNESDHLSVDAMSSPAADQGPHQRLLVTSSTRSRPRPFNGLLGGEAQAVTRNSERPPFRQNESDHLSLDTMSSPAADQRPHRRLLVASGRRSRSSLLNYSSRGEAEVVIENSETPLSRQSEPDEPSVEAQCHLGSLVDDVRVGQMLSVTSGSRSRLSALNQLSRGDAQAEDENAVGSHLSQNESMVASGWSTGRNRRRARHLSSDQEQPLPLKRRRSSINAESAALVSASGTLTSRLPGSVRNQVEGSTRDSHSLASQRPIEVDDLESPRNQGASIDLEDDQQSERARQMARDERLARSLQEDYNLEAAGGGFTFGDAQVARMLQEEENARSMRHMAQPPLSLSSFLHRNVPAVEAARREMQRGSHSVRSRSGGSFVSSSRTGLLRGLRSRSGQGRTRGRLLGGTAAYSDESMLQFPEGMDVDMRLEILAALESALQEHVPVGLRLEQVDRDFNEDDYEMLLALDDSNHEHSGASRERIDRLPVSTIQPTDVYEEICSICLEKPVVGENVRRLPCMHGFHQQCIDVWLKRQANCPICKGSI